VPSPSAAVAAPRPARLPGSLYAAGRGWPDGRDALTGGGPRPILPARFAKRRQPGARRTRLRMLRLDWLLAVGAGLAFRLLVGRPSPAPLPELAAKPLDDPPLVAALRCYLDRRPGDAIKWLERYERPNQDLLVGLLPLAARLTEGNLEKATPEEAAAMLATLD